MGKKTSARKTTSRREATPGARMRAEVRDHIIGVALGLFGLLSIVALLTSGGALPEWGHSVMTRLLRWGAVPLPPPLFLAPAGAGRRPPAVRLPPPRAARAL